MLIGHRGTRVHAPENSMAAFLWAAQAGADGVELDARRCGSGELVVFHDANLERIAQLPWQVVDTPYRELAAIEIGEGHGVPLLTDVLDEMLARGLLVHLEVKANGQDIDALNGAVVQHLGARSDRERQRICVSSFSRRVLAGVTAGCPQLAIATLAETVAQLPEPAGGGHPPQGGVGTRPAGVHPDHRLLTPARLGEYRAAGLFVNVWTVNDAPTARRLAADGVDGLITDDVAALKAAL